MSELFIAIQEEVGPEWPHVKHLSTDACGPKGDWYALCGFRFQQGWGDGLHLEAATCKKCIRLSQGLSAHESFVEELDEWMQRGVVDGRNSPAGEGYNRMVRAPEGGRRLALTRFVQWYITHQDQRGMHIIVDELTSRLLKSWGRDSEGMPIDA